jgi:hypothetical protein
MTLSSQMAPFSLSTSIHSVTVQERPIQNEVRLLSPYQYILSALVIRVLVLLTAQCDLV